MNTLLRGKIISFDISDNYGKGIIQTHHDRGTVKHIPFSLCEKSKNETKLTMDDVLRVFSKRQEQIFEFDLFQGTEAKSINHLYNVYDVKESR